MSDFDEKLLKSFEKLNEDWRREVEAMSTEQLKAALVEVNKNEAENIENREKDQEYLNAKAAYEERKYPYSAASTMNKLRNKFLVYQIKSNGA